MDSNFCPGTVNSFKFEYLFLYFILVQIYLPFITTFFPKISNPIYM